MKRGGISVAGLTVGWFPIVLSALLLGLGLMPEEIRTSLYFTPKHYGNGQWWLLFSSQWVHLNFQHTASNVVGVFLLCVLMLPRVSTMQMVLCTASCLLCISVFLVLFPKTYAFYAGFSGVLYGLFIFGGLSYWRQDKVVAALVIGAIVAKLVWDTVGPEAFERVDWLGARIAVEAHLAGIAGALIFVVFRRVYNHLQH